jgi:hypothetical protein
MPPQQIKGLLVNGETRNTKIVAALIAAMTCGALILLGLEQLQPRSPVWSPDTLLMAERGERVEDVVIEYLPAGKTHDPAEFDCTIHPDGRCEWRPRGPHVRLAVVGSPGGRLERAQQKVLLAVLGSMSQSRGLNLKHVRLHPDCDPQRQAGLPPAARELHAWLTGKRFGR